jgi:hypothetical protein
MSTLVYETLIVFSIFMILVCIVNMAIYVLFFIQMLYGSASSSYVLCVYEV